MESQTGKYEIKISSHEAGVIAYNIAQALKASVKDHWVNHLTTDFEVQEKESIDLMKQFYALAFCQFAAEAALSDCRDIIKKAKEPKSKN